MPEPAAPSKLWKCACGECNPDVVNHALNNCARCDYMAHSWPYEDAEDGTHIHRCPICGEQYWLDHETWSRMRGHWVAR